MIPPIEIISLFSMSCKVNGETVEIKGILDYACWFLHPVTLLKSFILIVFKDSLGYIM